MGFYTKRLVSVRLIGVNAPEKTGKEKAAGLCVSAFVENWLIDNKINLELISKEVDKFGRVLGDLVVVNIDKDDPGFKVTTTHSLSVTLLAKKYAKHYKGDKRVPFTQKEMDDIIKELA
jgi:endonuclease YncB( thermonuclease family)